MEKYSGNSITPEYVEMIVERIKSNESFYVDSIELEDAFDYLTQQQRFNDADLLSSFALRLYPDSQTIMLCRASLMIDMDRFEEARQMLSYVKPFASDTPEYQVACGWYELKQNRIDDAMKYFNRAAELDPDDEICFEIGVNLNQFGNYEYSQKFLERFLKKHPEDPESMFELAYAKDKTGDMKGSIMLYEEMLDSSPFFETAWYNLGILYNMSGELDKAIMAYETAIAINPEYPEPHYNLGNTLMTAMRYEEAICSYTEYAALCDSFDECHSIFHYIGDCWVEMENYDLALRSYAMAMRFDPKNPDYLYGHAVCCIEMKQYDEAMKDLDIVANELPDFADIYFAKAQIYFSRNELDKVGEQLIKGIEIDRNNVLAWFEYIKVQRDHSKMKWNTIIDINDKNFADSDGWLFIKALIYYTSLDKARQACNMIDYIANKSRETIIQASQEETLRKFLEERDINAILTKYNIDINNI